jgi:hypothetical protein
VLQWNGFGTRRVGRELVKLNSDRASCRHSEDIQESLVPRSDGQSELQAKSKCGYYLEKCGSSAAILSHEVGESATVAVRVVVGPWSRSWELSVLLPHHFTGLSVRTDATMKLPSVPSSRPFPRPPSAQERASCSAPKGNSHRMPLPPYSMLALLTPPHQPGAPPSPLKHRVCRPESSAVPASSLLAGAGYLPHEAAWFLPRSGFRHSRR